MNLAVVLALLLSVALVLAKKPFKESKGNKAAAMHKEADEAIVQAATEKIVEAEMADEAEADEEDEADSEEVKSAERNQANAYHRMMRPTCCSSCETMEDARAEPEQMVTKRNAGGLITNARPALRINNAMDGSKAPFSRKCPRSTITKEIELIKEP